MRAVVVSSPEIVDLKVRHATLPELPHHLGRNRLGVCDSISEGRRASEGGLVDGAERLVAFGLKVEQNARRDIAAAEVAAVQPKVQTRRERADVRRTERDREVDTTQTATIIVTNRGSGPGTVESVNVDGGVAFTASGLQLLPVEVNASGTLRFSIIFEPPEEGAFAGSAAIAFGMGSRSVSLAGTGVDGAVIVSRSMTGMDCPSMIFS